MKQWLLSVAVVAVLCGGAGSSPAQIWTESIAPGTNVGPIACSADGAKLLLAGGGWGGGGGILYLSDDSGATWRPANAPFTSFGWGSVASSADGKTLMATERSGAMYTSNDSGATWTSNALPDKLWGNITCSADGTRMYAVEFGPTNGSPDLIYTSVDSGSTWSPTGAPSAGWGPLASSSCGTTVIAGEGANVWVSTNSGADFRLVYTLAPPYISAGDRTACASVACSPDGTRMAAGSYAGYYYPWAGIATSADVGATWSFRTNGVALCSFVWMLAYSADGSRMAAVGNYGGPVGAVPLSDIFLSLDSGSSWYKPSTYLDNNDGQLPVAPWSGVGMSADGCKLIAVYMFGEFSDWTAVVADYELKPSSQLRIAASRGVLTLSWTLPSVPFVLQQSPTLTTASWTDVPDTPVLDYSTLRNRVTVPAPPGSMVFRLIAR